MYHAPHAQRHETKQENTKEQASQLHVTLLPPPAELSFFFSLFLFFRYGAPFYEALLFEGVLVQVILLKPRRRITSPTRSDFHFVNHFLISFLSILSIDVFPDGLATCFLVRGPGLGWCSWTRIVGNFQHSNLVHLLLLYILIYLKCIRPTVVAQQMNFVSSNGRNIQAPRLGSPQMPSFGRNRLQED